MNYREIVRYGAKGAVGTVANVALMSIFVEMGNIRPGIAAIGSTSVLLLLGYVVMDRWVFPDGKSATGYREHLWQGIRYYAVILSGKAINWLLFMALLSLNVWYPLSWIIGSLTVFGGTYTANRYLWKGSIR